MPRKFMRTIRDVSDDVSREALSTQPLLTDGYTYGDTIDRREDMIDGIPDSADQDIVKDVNQNGIPDDIENEQLKEHTRYQPSEDTYDPYDCSCAEETDKTVTNAFPVDDGIDGDPLAQDRLADTRMNEDPYTGDAGLEPGDIVEVDIVEIDLIDDSLDDEDYPIDGFMGDEITDEDLIGNDLTAGNQDDLSQEANRCPGPSDIEDALVSDGLINDPTIGEDTSMNDMDDQDLINNYRGDQQQRNDAIDAIESEEALNEDMLDKEIESDRLTSQNPQNKREESKDNKDQGGCGCSDW